jgi:hypothetical protein
MNAPQKAIIKKSQDQSLAKSLVKDPTLDPSADASTVIRHIVSLVDEKAAAMEAKWGRGELPKLVGEFLAGKFQSQASKFDAAIESGLSADVVKHGQAMIRAWDALDAKANELGRKPRVVASFLAKLADGRAMHIVESDADVPMVKGIVFTAQEIANMLSTDELGRIVLGTKTAFDCEVKQPVNWVDGDEIPF